MFSIRININSINSIKQNNLYLNILPNNLFIIYEKYHVYKISLYKRGLYMKLYKDGLIVKSPYIIRLLYKDQCYVGFLSLLQ